MRFTKLFAAAAGLALAASPAAALDHHMKSEPGRSVVELAAASSDFTTLVTAVKAADLATTLSGKGPFTVFAPTNAAFAKLPAGTVDSLVQPASKAQLQSILTYHVVAGRYPAARILQLIKQGGGTATLTTVQGGTLKASLMGSTVMLTDAKGGMVHVVNADIQGSNGVIHAIDGVVMP